MDIDEYISATRFQIEYDTKYEYLFDAIKKILNKYLMVINKDGRFIIKYCYTASVFPEIVEIGGHVYIIFDLYLFQLFSEIRTLDYFYYRYHILNDAFLYKTKSMFLLASGEIEVSKKLAEVAKKIDLELFNTKILIKDIKKGNQQIVWATLFTLYHEIGHYILNNKDKLGKEIRDILFGNHTNWKCYIEECLSRIKLKEDQYKESFCDILSFEFLCQLPPRFNRKKIKNSCIFALKSLDYILFTKDYIMDKNLKQEQTENRIQIIENYDKTPKKLSKQKKSPAIMWKISKHFYDYIDSYLNYIYRTFYGGKTTYNGFEMVFLTTTDFRKTDDVSQLLK